MPVEALTLSTYTEALVRKHISDRVLTDAQIAERFDFPVELVAELRVGPRPSKLFPGVYKSNVIRLPTSIPTAQTITLPERFLEPSVAISRVAVSFGVHRTLFLSNDRSTPSVVARAALIMLVEHPTKLPISEYMVKKARRDGRHMMENNSVFRTKVVRLRGATKSLH